MNSYALTHLSDEALLQGLTAIVAQDRTTTAAMLAHIAEVDERRLYLPAGYDSMLAYCVGELRLCEQAAAKRIFAARAARRCPAIFAAVAEGRLHLSAVVMLAPHLSEHLAGELIAAATHKTKAEIERLIAARFPRPEVLAWVAPIPTTSPAVSPGQHSPGNVEVQTWSRDLSPGTVVDRPRVKALSSQSYEVQYTMSQRAHELLCTAQALLSHQIPSGDISQVVERALELLVPHLQQRKYAATSRPRSSRRASRNPRHIPAEVMRAVWERDEGQCTYVSEAGHRCQARKRIEFDHVLEVARGGEATVEGLRLRCRGHNQYQAERTFGVEFMRRKRREAADARVAARQAAGRRRRTEGPSAVTVAQGSGAEGTDERDVVPWLRRLGYGPDQARRGAEACTSIPDASLEERVRLALKVLQPAHRRVNGRGSGHVIVWATEQMGRDGGLARDSGE